MIERNGIQNNTKNSNGLTIKIPPPPSRLSIAPDSPAKWKNFEYSSVLYPRANKLRESSPLGILARPFRWLSSNPRPVPIHDQHSAKWLLSDLLSSRGHFSAHPSSSPSLISKPRRPKLLTHCAVAASLSLQKSSSWLSQNPKTNSFRKSLVPILATVGPFVITAPAAVLTSVTLWYGEIKLVDYCLNMDRCRGECYSRVVAEYFR